MQSVIAWFVHRPLLVNLSMVLVFALGWMTIADMRYEYSPYVELGIVNVTTVKAGAGPEEVELSISLPLEEELMEVDGIKKLYSNSMENLSVITIQLDPDVEERATVMREIQSAVDRAESRLPADLIDKPLIDELSTTSTPVMEVHVTGDVPEQTLRDMARQVSDGLREVDGVASVTKRGYRRPEMRILLEPEKLARLGIPHEEVIAAIQARNVRDSGGAVDSFLLEKKVVAVGQFETPEEVESVVIRANEPGNAVLIRDVATVVGGFEDWEVQSRIDGRMSIALVVTKKRRADELHTAAAVREFVAAQQMPAGVELVMSADVSRLTVNMLEVLSGNALLGLAAVFFLLCYFLQLRFALWVVVGIPFAVCLTFLLLDWTGNTLNFSSLGGVILMLGILVDDAVVVSENTQRLRGEGMDPIEASIQGAGQVVMPVTFSALTTILAFAPILMMDGENGDWMRPFPVAVILLLAASLLESQAFLPAHLAHVPRRGQVPERKRFEAIRTRYHGLIHNWLQHRYRTLALFILMFVAVMALGMSTIRFSMFPDIDIDTVLIKVELPPGSRFEETVDVVAQLEGEVRQFVDERDLLNVTSQVGHKDTNFFGATEGRNHAWALISVQLAPINDRQGDTTTRGIEQTLQAWADDMNAPYKLTVKAQDDMPVVGEDVQIEVISNGEERYAVAETLQAWLAEHPGILQTWSSYTPGKDVIDLDINHSLLVSRGLTVEQLVRAVRIAVDGLLVDELQTLDERVRFRLQLPHTEAGTLASLRNLPIINSRGEPIYLSAVADFKLRPGEANIKHYWGKRTVTVYGQIDEGNYGLAEVNDDLQAFIASQDYGLKYLSLRLVDTSINVDTVEAGEELSDAALMCVLLIFTALIILFNSLSQPIVVMLCLPFGVIGVVLAYSVQGMDIGIMGVTGIVGLMGVLVNDSLVLMHTLNEKRKAKGASLDEAEVAAVAKQRFRPIVITSITTFVGLVPTAYGILGENSYLTPIFMSMAWGVAFGGLVTLILLPMLYMADQDIRTRFGRFG